jgi:hypothetical protein
MPIRRSIIIRVILPLGAAGSILAGSAASVAVTAAPSAVVATASSMRPAYVYHG